MEIKLEDGKWERVGDYTDRMKVPGGWLYRVKTSAFGEDVSVAFVPDHGTGDGPQFLQEDSTKKRGSS